MLAVTPTELGTDAERRLLAIMTGLGPGSSGQGGLVVFVPVVDGPRQRRQADALIFLPETLVVVRAVGIGRQGGELIPSAEHPWTVGGEVLRLHGGGSSPQPQLTRAVEVVGETLRAGGLDPGSLPSLVVLDGAITSVSRADAAAQAARMQARDVLAALRRCIAAGSQGDTRIWTTADVKAALDVLGIYGRVPSVEELNGEGFLYSPYVLRRLDMAGAGRGFAPAPVVHQSDPTGSGPYAEPTRALEPPTAASGSLAAMFNDEPELRRRRSVAFRLVAVLTVLAVVAALVVVLVGNLGRDTDTPDTASGESSPSVSASVSAEPVAPPEQELGGSTYTLAAPVQRDDDCAENAYGQVADFFVASPCTGLQRSLFLTDIGGEPAVVSLSIVTMPDEASAEEFRTLVDAAGTGNVSDLLRAGVRIDGGPAELDSPAFASALSDRMVRIAEVGWLQPGTAGDEAELEAAADRALQLQLPD